MKRFILFTTCKFGNFFMGVLMLVVKKSTENKLFSELPSKIHSPCEQVFYVSMQVSQLKVSDSNPGANPVCSKKFIFAFF